MIKPNGRLERRKYVKDYKGKPLGNNLTDINIASGGERLDYPTQKPLALLERITKASSNPGDVVLGLFAGCAATCVAAQQLDRKWIGIDIEKKAAQLLLKRLSDDAGLFSDFIHRKDRTMTGFRGTYKYQVKRGNKILHTGITNDILRREYEHQQILGNEKVHLKQVGNRTTIEEGLQWQAEQWEATQRKKCKSTGL